MGQQHFLSYQFFVPVHKTVWTNVYLKNSEAFKCGGPGFGQVVDEKFQIELSRIGRT